MKILIAADTYYPDVNGASYSTQRLAKQLQNRGHEILVITSSRKMHHENFSHANINIFGVRSYPLFFNDFRISLPIFIHKTIKNTIIDFQPDVIHITGHWYIQKEAFKVAQEENIPIVATNHFMAENLTHYLPFPKKIVDFFINQEWKKFKNVFENVDVVTTPTKTAANNLKAINFNKPIKIISNGINLERFSPTIDADNLKTEFLIPNKPSCIYVGRLDKEKNIDQIIKAYKIVLAKIDAHLILVGDGVEKERLKKLAKDLEIENNITFTGFVDDEKLPAAYRMADCFVIAGIAELQSIVTLEAMASGLPVIAADAIALPELAQPNINGFLFQPNDIKTLANNIIKILSDKNLRENMSKNSLAIVQNHDIRKILEQMESTYQEAIKNKERPAS